MGTGQSGKRRQVMHPFGLDHRWPRRLVPLGPRFAGGQQVLLQLGNRFSIFAMGRHNNAPAFGQFQRAKQLGIVDAEGAFVRQKDFERGGAVVDDFSQLVGRVLVESRHAHVKRVVARRLSRGFRFPQFVRFQRIVGAAGADHFDQRRRAADQRRAAGGSVGVFGERAHERQINVDVRIDEARETPAFRRHRSLPPPAERRKLGPIAVMVSPSHQMSAL